MSKIKLAAAAAILALSLPAVAAVENGLGNQAASLDSRAFPNLTQIYVASGARDNAGESNIGVATVIHCTNFTAAPQQVRFLIRGSTGAVAANVTLQIPVLGTLTAATHGVLAFASEFTLSPGTNINQGSLRIFATAPQITCTAMVIDASTIAPIGTNLHLVRHNAWANTQE